jgi:hypothetical protein
MLLRLRRIVADYTQESYPVAPWDTPGLPPRRMNERCHRRMRLCAYRDDDPAYCWRCHVSRTPDTAVCPKCQAAEKDRPR